MAQGKPKYPFTCKGCGSVAVKRRDDGKVRCTNCGAVGSEHSFSTFLVRPEATIGHRTTAFNEPSMAEERQRTPKRLMDDPDKLFGTKKDIA